MRKNKQYHTRCKCGAGTSGKHNSSCPCTVDKDLCTCSKKKKKQPSDSGSAASGSACAPSSSTGPVASSNNTPNTSNPINIPVSKHSTLHHSGVEKYTRTESANNLFELKRKKNVPKNHASSASLSKLSLMTNDLTPSPPDRMSTNSPIPMFLNFGKNNESYDLLNSLDSIPMSNKINDSTTSLSSFSSGLITSSSNNDGYVSDIDPPLQLNFNKIGLMDSSSSIAAARTVYEKKTKPGQVIVKPGDFDDFTLLSPSDNYEVLQNGNSCGLLDLIDSAQQQQQQQQQVEQRSDQPNIRSVSSLQFAPISSIPTPNFVATSSRTPNPSMNQQFPSPINSVPNIGSDNAPLFPILTANRPHKEVDYKSMKISSSTTSPLATPSPTVAAATSDMLNSGNSNNSNSSDIVPGSFNTSSANNNNRSDINADLSSEMSMNMGLDMNMNTNMNMSMDMNPNMNMGMNMNELPLLPADLNLMSTMNAMNLVDGAGLSNCNDIKPGLLDLNLPSAQAISPGDLSGRSSNSNMPVTNPTVATTLAGTDELSYGMYDFLPTNI